MATADILTIASDLWHPVASISDLAYRHVYQGELLGQELAIWKADDDFINVWENRCLHRGVRLSIGQNDGRELKCQYHGWKYANRTADCIYIPAHPADAPPRTISNRTYQVRLASGLVWTTTGQPATEPLETHSTMAARPMPVSGRPEDVVRVLLDSPPSLESPGSSTAVQVSDFAVEVPGAGVFFVQPVNSDCSVIRGVIDSRIQPEDPLARIRLLARVDTELTRVRKHAQELSTRAPVRPRISPSYEPVAAELASMPETTDNRELPTRVQVAEVWDCAKDIRAMRLEAIDDRVLPTGQPGAHIDVALPNGLIRQYSLINGPGETDAYILGVKRTPDSEGGSRTIHEVVNVGDVLAVSLPRNNFPLRRDRDRTVFVAGGIGITPLLAMAQTLQHYSLNSELHYFVASEEDVAFKDRIEALEDVRVIPGLNPAQTGEEIERILGSLTGTDFQLYICGPPPMLDAVRKKAAESGLPSERISFEYFLNDQEIDDSSEFEIAHPRSVMNLTVKPGTTILQTLRAAGVTMASSCEQGACGTCQVTVIDGEPDHQDVYLSDAEKESGNCMMTCVSRAKSPSLTLDL